MQVFERRNADGRQLMSLRLQAPIIHHHLINITKLRYIATAPLTSELTSLENRLDRLAAELPLIFNICDNQFIELNGTFIVTWRTVELGTKSAIRQIVVKYAMYIPTYNNVFLQTK